MQEGTYLMPSQRHSAKFDLLPEFDLAAFVKSFQTAQWRASRGKTATIRGAVVDTPEREILSAGLVALEEGAGARKCTTAWVLPKKGGPAEPLVRLTGGDAKTFAAQLATRARLRLRGALAPVVRYERSTTPIEFLSSAGSVRAICETMSSQDGEKPAALLRLEVARGNADTLALASGLSQLAPGVGKRVENGPRGLLAALGIAPGPRTAGKVSITRDMTARQAVIEILRRDYANLLANEPGARVGIDEEFVHDMRVATRRVRAALRMFSKVFAKGSTDHLSEEIKWLASVLGAVRDLDVYMQAVPKYLAYAQWEPPDYRFYCDGLAEKRKAARETLLAALDSQRYAALKREVEAFLAKPSFSAGRGSVKSISRQRIEALAAKAQGAGDKARTDEELHAARIAFKRARYAAEFTRGLAPKQLGKLARTAMEYQDILGRHQDAIIACDRVREALALEKEDRLKAFLLGYLLACQRLSAIDSKKEFFRRWRGGGSDEFAAAAKAAVARL
jgi:CHAD domain-containing protein